MRKYSREELKQEFNITGDLICIDLGCGTRKQKGYIGVDSTKLEGVDITCDVEKGLPFKDNTIDRVYSDFLFEHIANFTPFMQELYRICRNGAIILTRVPYWSSVTQWKDSTHKQVITVETFRYFSTDKWYGSDYGINTNFKLKSSRYCYLPPFHRRWIPSLFKKIARKYFINVVHSVWIELEVIK